MIQESKLICVNNSLDEGPDSNMITPGDSHKHRKFSFQIING